MARSGVGHEALAAAGQHALRPECLACDVRHLAFCAGLPPERLALIDDIRTRLHLDTGATLFDEGDAAVHVYNVTRGGLRLSKLLADGRRQVTAFALPGDFVGLIARNQQVCTAEAVTDTEICRFNRRDLDRLFQQEPALQGRLLQLTRDALAEAQERMLLLGRKAPAEKLASFLLDLSHRAVRQCRPASPLPLPMNRGDIADFLGLTVETVSRTFTRFRQDGLIELPEANLVVLRDAERLRLTAEGEA